MPEPELRRSLSLLDATLLNVGTMVGSGIFLTSASIARDLDASLLHLAVWTAGGLFSILGALTIAELGAMMPEAGGIYVYLERAFGAIWGFLYGWALFLAIQCGSIAAIAVAGATYLGWFVPMSPAGTRLLAVGLILLLTYVNTRGVAQGAFVQNALTLVKVAAVLALGGAAVLSGSAERLEPLVHDGPILPLLPSLGLAMVAAMWCYDGWIHLSYVGGEVRDPGRTLPRAAILSTLAVLALYVGLNVAYLMVLGVPGMAASDLVASETARAVLGPAGGGLVAALVAISCFGACNGFILAGARVYYAMARDGLFFQGAARVDPDRAVPAVSLVLQALWSSALVFSGTYDQIFTYVIFVEFAFFGLAAAAVFVLRRREPGRPRPYRVPGHPITPLAFIAFAAALMAATIWGAPREAAIGAAVLLTGLPAFAFWDRRRRAESASSTLRPGC
jgi:APA family basic amino acid/polyamine antiporter